MGNYQNNVASNLDSSVLNLSEKEDSYLQFKYSCDTEEGYDGLILFFYNGSNWEVVDAFTGYNHGEKTYPLADYAINNFQFRFGWYTDESIGGIGCYVDNIKVIDAASNNGSYQYMDGTSMAAPQVAGLAALIWGYKPDLTYSEVKNVILTTGDDIPDLNPITGTHPISTGKRINAFNALDSITPPVISDVQASSTTATSTAILWTTDKNATSTVFYATTTPLISALTVFSNTATTSHSLELTGLSANTTYYFYAASADKYGNIATSTEQSFTTLLGPDITAPIITLIGSNTVNIYVGVTYADDGATALDNIDGDITDNIAIIGLPIDTTATGTHIITYNVSDAAGNPADEVTRTVNVSEVPDTTPPVITLTGDAIITIEVGDIYVDEGATAQDNVDGDISGNIVIAGDVLDNQILGTYVKTFNVSDSAGNAATEVTRTVNVVDTEAPVITLSGDDPVTIEVDSIYSDDGATAADNYDGDITGSIVTVNSVDENTVGQYTVTYNVVDSSGNLAVEVTRTVNVVDTTAPVITLAGDDPVTIEVGSVYSDAGATASDNYDGNITGSIATVNSIEPDTLGIYTVTYNVSDQAGNSAVEVTRTVNVVDTTAPAITLLGNNPITIPIGTTYNDAGATASDNYDGNITANISTVNNVNINALGVYTVTYNVSDSSGNHAVEVIRTVNIVDVSTPIITLLGNNPATVEVGSIYNDAGATAIDDVDGDLTNSIVVVNNVATNTVGSYTVTYNVSDSSDNSAPEIVRTVNVVDTEAPVIVLNGDNPVNIEVGYEYNDAGATANDNYDGDITENIATTSNVNTNIVGSYTVTYNISDSSGNFADEIVRIVNVTPDVTSPVITLLGSNTVNIYVGDAYTDDGATAVDNIDGDLTNSIVVLNNVATNTVGSYTVTYNVSDSAGNPADEVTRTVNVNPDTTPPVRDNGLPTGELESGVSQAPLSLTTDEDAVCRYATTTDIEFGIMTGVFGDTGSTTHSTLITGLTDGNSYSYYVKCEDGSGNANAGDYKINFSIAKTPEPKSEPAPVYSSGGGGGGGYTPADTTPPAQPANFKADRQDARITLTWKNPNNSDFKQVFIVKSDGLIESGLSIDALKAKGEVVYEGDGEQWVDENVDNGATYYYAIVAYDKKLNYTKPLIIETMPKIGNEVKVLGVESDYRAIQLKNILKEAGIVEIGDVNSVLNNTGKTRNPKSESAGYYKYTAPLIAGFELADDDVNAITNFIVYGTHTTSALGAGERAGVINSYKAAFGKLPTTRSEWEDVIKIANGRWPSERSEAAVERAKQEFKKVYLREPDMNNSNDNAAVTIIAYGLRPDDRNLDSEKAAIKTFKAIYGYNPSSAIDWDTVRAIAYSGATR